MALSEPIITDFEHRLLNRGVIIANMQFACTAVLIFPNGDVVGVSRYDNEDFWVVDSHIKKNGYPVFCNGVGVRCSIPNRLKKDAPTVLLLDESRNSVMDNVMDKVDA